MSSKREIIDLLRRNKEKIVSSSSYLLKEKLNVMRQSLSVEMDKLGKELESIMPIKVRVGKTLISITNSALKPIDRCSEYYDIDNTKINNLNQTITDLKLQIKETEKAKETEIAKLEVDVILHGADVELTNRVIKLMKNVK